MTAKKLLSLFLSSVMLMLVFPFAVNAGGTENAIFVAPNGNDTASGSISSPLATLKGAKEKAKTMNGNVTVYFREGTYTFDSTVNFNSTDKANVTYKSYNGEKVVFTAGKPYTGFEECTVNGVKAFRKNVGTDADFNILFNETTTLSRTRYPESGYLYVKDALDSDWLNRDATETFHHALAAMIVNTDEVPEFKNSEDVVIRILHYWKDEMLTIKSYDKNTGRLEFNKPSSMNVAQDDRYFFENVFEALDTPGEWYLDKNEGVLYYIPYEGEVAETLTLWGSETETMIKISGVDGISFENIIFRANGFNINPDRDFSQAAYDATPCVFYENADNFSILNCEFRDIAACAVFIGTAVKNCEISNNIFDNLGAQAVYIRGENVAVDSDRVTKNITVSNNIISSYGRVFFNAVGVLVIHANTVDVSHNEIHDGYYTAISCGWVWGYAYNVTYNNKICDNLIYNIGQGWLSDMGGIYMLGVQPGTVLSGNVIHNVAADPEQGGYGGWGIYLDEGSSDMLVEKNLVYACGSDSYHLHYGADNTIKNNIFALSSDSVIRVNSRYEEHLTAEFYNNIILTDNKTPVFSYVQEKDVYSAHDNFLWDLSNGDKVFVTKDGDNEKAMKLATAKRKGYIGKNITVNPEFADVDNFDFTLSENSPVFAYGFESWDYQNAGTLENTVIGLDTLGGQTAYNSNSEEEDYKGGKEFFPLFNGLVNYFVRLINMLRSLFGLSEVC